MKTSLILFTLSKHLNMAAIEIEQLENAVLKQKLEDMSNKAPEIEVSNGPKETNEKASESSEASATKEKLQVTKKATSSKKAKKEEVAPLVGVNVPPPIPQEAIKRQLTAEIVRAECKKVIDSKGKPKIIEMLKALGADKFSDVKESDYEILFNACRLELGESNEF